MMANVHPLMLWCTSACFFFVDVIGTNSPENGCQDASSEIHRRGALLQVQATTGAAVATGGSLEPDDSLHRFCPEGKLLNMCGHQFARFDEIHGQAIPGRVGCLNLKTLTAETAEQCRNFERAFELLTNDKIDLGPLEGGDTEFEKIKLTEFRCKECVQTRKAPFEMLGTWARGTCLVYSEFAYDTYYIKDLSMGAGSMLFDIGANIGFFSVTAGLSFPDLQIVAFEPQPLNFLLTYHNVATNGLLGRVQLVNKALTSTGQSISLGYDRPNPGGIEADYENHGRCQKEEEGSRVIGQELDHFTVDSTTFQQALTTYAGSDQRISAKLDCECCEYEISEQLVAAKQRIVSTRGEIHINCPDKVLSKSRLQKVLSVCQSTNEFWETPPWAEDILTGRLLVAQTGNITNKE